MPTDRPRAVAGTRGPGVVAEDALRSAQDGPACSVKDSFADFDLVRLGFDELFEAQWIFREPALAARKSALIWTAVKTDDELAEWTDAAGLSRMSSIPATDQRRSRCSGEAVRAAIAVENESGSLCGAVRRRSGRRSVWHSLAVRISAIHVNSSHPRFRQQSRGPSGRPLAR
jgi:hypothetical protein